MILTKQNNKPGHPELRGSVEHIKYPAWAETKFDGEFCYVIYAGLANTCLVNKYGTVRQDFPALVKIAQRLKSQGLKAGIFLAELYHGDGKLGALYDLNSNKQDDGLNLKCFDVFQVDSDEVTGHTLLDRKEILADCLGTLAIVGEVVDNRAEADNYFKQIVGFGYEGIVLKNFDSTLTIGPCDWAKMKYKDQNDYEVKLVDSSKERIEILAPIPGPQVSFIGVGVKAPNRYKKHICVGDKVTVEHQGVLKSGSLRHPVLIPKPEWK